MKKLYFSFTLVSIFACLGLNSVEAQNNGNTEQQLKAKAISWYHTQCNGKYTGPIEVSLRGLRHPCPEGSNGSGYVATLIPKVNCNVVPCHLILLIQLGTLRFDCYGDIADSQCGF